jgi:hypothetical protein
MGSAEFALAAAAYVHAHPPTAPCIAEYGEGFPDFVARLPISERAHYLAAVARADWHLGQVSIAIAEEPLAIEALAAMAQEELWVARLKLQPGLRFLATEWPIDSLVALHLNGNPPEQFVLENSPVGLQFRGARGAFSVERLDPATFAFRCALKDGATLGEAAEKGVAARGDFDPGGALASLFAAGLVVCAERKSDGGFS